MSKTKEEILGSANTITDYLGNEFDYYTEEQALSAMDAYALQAVEEKLLEFKEWYDQLSPSDKCSVWGPDGLHLGFYTMSDKDLIKKFLEKKKP